MKAYKLLYNIKLSVSTCINCYKASNNKIYVSAQCFYLTHVDVKVFCDSPAVFSQHTKRHALLQKDPYFILVLKLHL